MKRIKYIAGLLAIVGIFSANAGEVESINMVGYSDVNAPKGSLSLIGVPFDGVAKECSLATILNTTGLNEGGPLFSSGSDLIYIYNGSGYDIYALKPGVGWVAYADYVTATEPADVQLEPGDGFWLSRTDATVEPATVKVLGEVVTAESISKNVEAGLDIMSYPYSSSVTLASFTTDGVTMGGPMFSSGSDLIYVYNGSGYDIYACKPGVGWVAYTDYVTATEASDVEIPAGESFWYDAQASTTLEFNKPY